jgi:SWIM zinc finger
MGSTDALLWGKCQGSGKDPYQVSVDLNGPAYRCTCPSRKFPCKHGVALMLMWAANDGSVADVVEVAAFAEEWAAERGDKAAKAVAKAEKVASGEVTVDPVAKAKREAKRASTIDAGLQELDRWMLDLVKQGNAAARSQPYAYWDSVAARLVDAQAPGLAERIRQLPSIASASEHWNTGLLQELGFLAAVSAGWQRRDQLDDAQVAELRRVLGWARQSEEVLAGGLITGSWVVAGRTQEERGPITTQRTWLWSIESQHWVLQLDTAAGGGALPVGHGVGNVIVGTAAYYPGLAPVRLLPVALEVGTTATSLPNPCSVSDATTAIADTYAANPWVGSIPLTLERVAPVKSDGFHLVDDAGYSVRLSSQSKPWLLVSLSGGAPIEVFGEWFDGGFHPLAVTFDGRVIPL